MIVDLKNNGAQGCGLDSYRSKQGVVRGCGENNGLLSGAMTKRGTFCSSRQLLAAEEELF
jgi:hypothetical protein